MIRPVGTLFGIVHVHVQRIVIGDPSNKSHDVVSMKVCKAADAFRGFS